MRKLLIFLLLICPAVWASVGLSGVKLSNVKITPYYTTEAAFTMGDGTLLNGAVTLLRGYNRAIGGYNVRIPAYINGNPVRVIKEKVFATELAIPPNPKLQSITFPNTLQNIGFQACYLNDLTSVSFGNNLQTIGISAFSGNPITRITIPANVVLESAGSAGIYGEAFKALYDGNGKQAGTYVYADSAWGKL